MQFLGLGAQNLVLNPSFETYTACPNSASQLSKSSFWYGTNGSSDYFNSCAPSVVNVPNTIYGYQTARTGNAYAGGYFINGYGSNYREYVQNTWFSVPLVSNNCYFIKFYVSCASKVINFACNNIAAQLSVLGYTTNFTGFPATTYTPQIYLIHNPIITDSLNWIEIGGIYTATGGENHITIGNFKNDANTDTVRTGYGTINNVAYYFIDDVSVEQITAPTWQLRDTMILVGDSVLIGPLYSGLPCTWFNMGGNQIGTGSGIWVKPNITTNYILHETICGNTFADTMTVFVSSVGVNENELNNFTTKIYPNPSNGFFTIEVNNAVLHNELFIEIFDVIGKLVYTKKQKLDGKTFILQANLEQGSYIVKLKSQLGTTDIHRLVISK